MRKILCRMACAVLVLVIVMSAVSCGGSCGESGGGFRAAVEKAEINEKGELVLTYANGMQTNYGKVELPPNADGLTVERVEINENGEYVLFFTDGQRLNVGTLDGEVGVKGEVRECNINESGEFVVKFVDGKEYNLGKIDNHNLLDVSVDSFSISEKGELMITLTDGSIHNAGKISNKASAYELYKTKFGYDGDEEQWRADLLSGELKDYGLHTVFFILDNSFFKRSLVANGGLVEEPTVNSNDKEVRLWTSEGKVWDFAVDTVTQDTVLIGSLSRRDIQIGYDLDGGTNSDMNPVSVQFGATLELSKPSKTAYDFVGWTWKGQDVPQKEVSMTVTGDISFTAHWVADSSEIDPLYYEIYEIEKYTPKIDGELDAQYAYSRVVNLRNNGPSFAKGQIYYLWDDEAIYFYVEIHDTTPTDPHGIDQDSDCIDMLFSLYDFDVNADFIEAKRADDIGDAQFRVFRTKAISPCTTVVDNGILYPDGSHGGFGKWVFENTDFEDPQKGSNYILHWTDDGVGYGFEGFIKWSPALLEVIEEGLIIGLGVQVNDDNNNDGDREMKCYNENAGPNNWSMTSDRSTCGKFRMVDRVSEGDGKQIFNVSYDTKDGENHPANPDAVIEGDSIKLCEPTKLDHIFLGWTWDGQKVPTKNVDLSLVSSDITFIANWEKKDHAYSYTSAKGNWVYELDRTDVTVIINGELEKSAYYKGVRLAVEEDLPESGSHFYAYITADDTHVYVFYEFFKSEEIFYKEKYEYKYHFDCADFTLDLSGAEAMGKSMRIWGVTGGNINTAVSESADYGIDALYVKHTDNGYNVEFSIPLDKVTGRDAKGNKMLSFLACATITTSWENSAEPPRRRYLSAVSANGYDRNSPSLLVIKDTAESVSD